MGPRTTHLHHHVSSRTQRCRCCRACKMAASSPAAGLCDDLKPAPNSRGASAGARRRPLTISCTARRHAWRLVDPLGTTRHRRGRDTASIIFSFSMRFLISVNCVRTLVADLSNTGWSFVFCTTSCGCTDLSAAAYLSRSRRNRSSADASRDARRQTIVARSSIRAFAISRPPDRMKICSRVARSGRRLSRHCEPTAAIAETLANTLTVLTRNLSACIEGCFDSRSGEQARATSRSFRSTQRAADIATTF